MSTDVDPAITAAIVAGALALPGAIFTWRVGKKANQIASDSAKATNGLESRKVDQEAYDRAITFYKDQLTYMQGQVDRLLANQDKMASHAQALESKDRSQQEEISSLKRLLGINQETINQLQGTVKSLQNQLEAALAQGTPVVRPTV